MKSWVRALLWAIWPLLVLTPLLLWLGRGYADQLVREQRGRTQHTLDLHADAVQRSFDQIYRKLDGLAEFVADEMVGGKPIDLDRFNTFAAGVHASSTWIRAFQIVTDGTITHAYPLKGNEAVLGFNLLKAPEAFVGTDVTRALRTGHVTITGPLTLVQGGLGVVIRRTLPRNDPAATRLVGIVFNTAPFLVQSGLRENSDNGTRIAIRTASGDVFFGLPAVFENHPVVQRLPLADGAWEIGACPDEGWQTPANRPVLLFYLTGAVMIFLLCLLVFVLAYGRANSRTTVSERTEALRKELAARERAQEELQESYFLLQAVTEGTSDSVFAKDRQGRYQMINSAGARYLGRTPATIIGQTDAELFAADTAPAIMDADRQVLVSGKAITVEEKGSIAGTTRVYLSTKAPWRDRHGDIIGTVGVARDITGRKRMEEALRESERQLSLVLNNVSDVIFAIAVESDGGFRFTSVNQRFLEATGLTEIQIVGARVEDVVPESAQALVMGRYRDAIQSGRPAHWEEVSEYPAGRKIGVVTVVPVLDAGGVCTQLVGMVHDITERQQAEEQIRRLNEELRLHAEALERRVTERTTELVLAKERAEKADRVKSDFLANMSHELRTPLNSIIGFTGLILQGLAGPLNPEQTKQLRMVKDSSHHLLELINDVLDISKIEAGQLKIAPAPFNFRDAVQKVAKAMTPLAEKKGLSLVVEVDPGVGEITSDRRRVEQILLNLVSNALKFTVQGEVRLECRRVGDAVVTRVIDTGPGIKPESITQLFQPFLQLDTGLTRHHEGTGLGLAICKRLVDRLGGTIGVESGWGAGSCFHFTLPLYLKRNP